MDQSGSSVLPRPEPDSREQRAIYAGEFRHQLDSKNRVTIPSRWRRSDQEELIMLAEQNNAYVVVMPTAEFARTAAQIERSATIPAAQLLNFMRQFHARAQHGQVDRQGRLVLPDELCKQVGLKGELVLVGGRGRFEIWNLARRQRAHQDEAQSYQQIANMLGL